MEELIENYKYRIDEIRSFISQNERHMDEEYKIKLKTKISCFQEFIYELQNLK